MLPYWLQIILFISLMVAAAYVLWPLAVSARLRRRELWALLLRAGTFAILLLAVANPPWQRTVTQTVRPRLVVLRDVSASMDLRDAGGRSRAEEATARLEEARENLAAFETVEVPFAHGLNSATQDRQTTDLAQAMRQAMALYQPQALLVISDGAETAGEARQAAAQAARLGTRVYAAGTGSARPPLDVGPVTIQTPRVVKEDQALTITANVGASGVSGTQPVEVSLDGRVIARPEVALGERVPLRQQVPGLAAGYHLLTVRALPRAGEATLSNNERTVMIEARRDKTRFVVLAGAPSPEYANFKRAVEGLPRMEFDWHVRVAKGAFVHETGERPQRKTLNLARLLDKRHVLVLMNIEASAVEAAAVRSFVMNGGALALLGGARSLGSGGYAGSALAGLLPVRVGAADYADTPTAVSAPVTTDPLGKALAAGTGASYWTGAPFLAGVNRVNASGAGIVVLRSRQGLPLLITGTSGLGRTLVFASDGTYRWVLSPQADEQSQRLHEVFWQTVVSWLAQPREDRQVLLMLDPPVAPLGQPVRALVQVSRGLEPVAGAPVSLKLQRASFSQTLQARATTVPGRYQAAIGELEAGTYVVTAEAAGIGKDERKLVVEPGGAEMARLTLQDGALREVARAGGGQYAPVAQLGELLTGIPREGTSRSVKLASHPWRSWRVLVVVLMLLTAEWVLRRRWGM
ncbi:MAG: glutamine amidotransferase [Armatimonadota bacterium]